MHRDQRNPAFEIVSKNLDAYKKNLKLRIAIADAKNPWQAQNKYIKYAKFNAKDNHIISKH